MANHLGFSDILRFLIFSIIYGILICKLGVLYGLLAIIIFQYLHDYLMKKIFGLVPLGTMDELFLYDNETNRANIIGCLVIEKFKLKEFKE